MTEGQTYASVTSTGLVKGLAEGNATVTATAGKQTDTVQITVQYEFRNVSFEGLTSSLAKIKKKVGI